MKTVDPALLRRILPALRTMARFPSMPAKNISFQTGIERSEIDAYVAARGRPKMKDIPAIEREVDEGVAPAPVPATADEVKAHHERYRKDVPAEDPIVRPVEQVAPDAAWPWATPGRKFHSAVVEKYLPLIEVIRTDPRLSQADVCRRFGINEGTFSAWRLSTFATSQWPTPEACEAFIAWALKKTGKRQGAVQAAVAMAPGNFKSEQVPKQGRAAVPPELVAKMPALSDAVAPKSNNETHAIVRKVPGTRLVMKLTLEIFPEGGDA